MEFQSSDLRSDASTIWALVPFRKTGSTCLKSPPNTTVFPPNGRSGMSIMSCMLLSSASTVCLLVIDASSQIISDFAWGSLAVPLCLVNPQTAPSSIFSGILNLECAILPPGIMEAATPEVVVATAIFPCLRIVAKSAL
ncbi:hypothetical protein ACQJBY_026867 [Aegilops geniculata]